MIKLTDNPRLLREAEQLNPVGGCTVSALYSVYNGCPFIDFYIHEQNGAVKGSLCRYDGSVTVCCAEAEDEMVEFLVGTGGFAAADLPLPLAKRLQEKLGGRVEEYIVMQGEGDYLGTAQPCKRTDDIYNINGAAGAPCGDKAAWTADFSHRLRHGSTAAFCTYINDKPAACAAAAHISEKYGIIGYVATLPEYRGRGMGGDCVRTAAAHCQRLGLTPLVVCKSELVAFYTPLDFRQIGSRAGFYLTGKPSGAKSSLRDSGFPKGGASKSPI